MAPRVNGGTITSKRAMNRGAWTPEEDRKLAQCIEIHGAKRWKTVAIKSGLNRCGKSCRLRWLNYLRPNIKRGNISDEEEDLILRLHRLLGNRFLGDFQDEQTMKLRTTGILICKKVNQKVEKPESSTRHEIIGQNDAGDNRAMSENEVEINESSNLDVSSFDVNEFFNFSEESFGFDWLNKYLELDQIPQSTE
ncbi:hypothetical protein JHK82_047499 [Glycine max]|nr:hypothetical protein JHK82_047499 [Glycine max]